MRIEQIYAQINEQAIFQNTTIDMVENAFLNSIYSEYTAIELKGVEIYTDTISFGGWFSSKTKVLVIEAKKSKIKEHKAYFFVTHNGKSYEFFLYRVMQTKYFSKFVDKPQAQRLESLRGSFKSLEERHSFIEFEGIVTMLFANSMKKVK